MRLFCGVTEGLIISGTVVLRC
eukprot:COSAG01_NODE_73250_length_249_cov_49.000000_1_plen_21_part_01